ncbi:hypothetical protein [Burkholderia sp. BCC1644]|uniref:hypothetical protein n=1 Tax=Burkholderia sp. BCC1644 TaxID=2676293 RepID=UPI0015909A22|nr:hypothetical protein [Burkholderia sp. BCC1644]
MAHRNFPGRDGQRRAAGNARALPARTASAGNRPSDDLDTLLALAREAGLLVTLDGQIGREKYQSVAGSILALQRFAAALGARQARAEPAGSEPRRKARPGWPHANRLRSRTCSACGPMHVVRPRSRVRRGVVRRHDLCSILRTT